MKKELLDVVEYIVRVADDFDDIGLYKIAGKLDSIASEICFDDLMKKTAGEKMNHKEWEISDPSLQGNDWAMDVSRGEDEDKPKVYVKIQDGVMTVRYKDKIYRSGIQFQSEYFYSDKFKNSIARVFRGLVTGKVSFTSAEEMYDLEMFKKVKPDYNEKGFTSVKNEGKEETSKKDSRKTKPNKTDFEEDAPKEKPEEEGGVDKKGRPIKNKKVKKQKSVVDTTPVMLEMPVINDQVPLI